MNSREQKTHKYPSQYSFLEIRNTFNIYQLLDATTGLINEKASFAAAAQALDIKPAALQSYLSRCILKYIDPALETQIHTREFLYTVVTRLSDTEAENVQERYRQGIEQSNAQRAQHTKAYWAEQYGKSFKPDANNQTDEIQQPLQKRVKTSEANLEYGQTAAVNQTIKTENLFIESLLYLTNEIQQACLEMQSIKAMQAEIRLALERQGRDYQSHDRQNSLTQRQRFSFYTHENEKTDKNASPLMRGNSSSGHKRKNK